VSSPPRPAGCRPPAATGPSIEAASRAALSRPDLAGDVKSLALRRLQLDPIPLAFARGEHDARNRVASRAEPSCHLLGIDECAKQSLTCGPELARHSQREPFAPHGGEHIYQPGQAVGDRRRHPAGSSAQAMSRSAMAGGLGPSPRLAPAADTGSISRPAHMRPETSSEVDVPGGCSWGVSATASPVRHVGRVGTGPTNVAADTWSIPRPRRTVIRARAERSSVIHGTLRRAPARPGSWLSTASATPRSERRGAAIRTESLNGVANTRLRSSATSLGRLILGWSEGAYL
jgi:hypothetical protein